MRRTERQKAPRISDDDVDGLVAHRRSHQVPLRVVGTENPEFLELRRMVHALSVIRIVPVKAVRDDVARRLHAMAERSTDRARPRRWARSRRLPTSR